jgi:hypothetical protein
MTRTHETAHNEPALNRTAANHVLPCAVARLGHHLLSADLDGVPGYHWQR